MSQRISWREVLARNLYACLWFFCLPLIGLLLIKKGKAQALSHKGNWRERFGRVPDKGTSYDILFHCVSVGEVVTASGIIQSLLNSEPKKRIFITTTSPTGSARVREMFGDAVGHCYLPFDFSFSMKTMYARIRPKLVVITEVELWPNMIYSAWKKSIPIMVLNGRMTEKSARRYLRISSLFQPMLARLSLVCAQGIRDFDQYTRLGVDKQRLILTNNLKFDQASMSFSIKNNYFGAHNDNVVTIIGGSTHVGEEVALLHCFSRLISANKKVRLIIIPRYPHRFEEVAQCMNAMNLSFIRTSHMMDFDDKAALVLVDEMGKLNQAYFVGDIAFVGGSLADKGGHNALEAAAASLPIVMGPSIYNNQEICQALIESGALEIVASPNELSAKITQWVNESERRTINGRAGKKVLIDSQGAIEKSLSAIQTLLPDD